MELVVQPSGRALNVHAGDNLLEVLQANLIPISYSCRAGRCGTCRCRVLAGSVMASGHSDKMGGPDGADAANVILACMSVLMEDCIIEIAEPDEIVAHPARILKATVAAIEDLTHDIKRLLVKPSRPLSFSPGQYATLQFSPEHIRSYSMASLPDDEMLEFHIRAVPNGRVTGYIFNQLKAGDALRISGPLGTAYLRTRHDGPMLCIAGGTGLAPVLSIIRGAVAAGMRNPVHLYFGVRSSADIYGLDWLQSIASDYPQLQLHIVVATGDTERGHRQGLVTDVVAQDWASLRGWRAYLCGAPPMVEAAVLLVKARGVEAQHIYADAFYASTD